MRTTALPLNKACDITITSLVTTLISLSPFTAVLTHAAPFQARYLRLTFLTCIATAWPCFLAASAISLEVYMRVRREQPHVRHVFAADASVLPALLWSALLAALGYFLLIVAQGIWIYAAAQVAIVWLLCLLVLGMAVLVVVAASMLAIAAHAMRLRGDSAVLSTRKMENGRKNSEQGGMAGSSAEVVLRLDKDESSPQNIVAKIPNTEGHLDF